MDRRQTLSQQSIPMSRKRSNPSGMGTSPFTHTRGISPLTITNQQTDDDEYSHNLTATSPLKLRRTNSGQKHLPYASGVTVYNPEDYIRQAEAGDNSKTYSLPVTQGRKPSLALSHISVSPNLASSLSNHYQPSVYSSTPTSAGLTDATSLSHGMSRQSSISGSLCGGIKMMRIRSQTSEMSDFSPHASGEQSPQHAKILPDNPDVTHYLGSQLIDYTHSPVQEAYNPSGSFFSDASTQLLRPTRTGEETKMARAKSADLNSSSASRIRRRKEQLAHSERRIAPKLSDEVMGFSQLSSSNHPMVRVKSADGKLTEKFQISKTAYTRPPRAKVRCTQCNEHPEGFRGEHELRRHMDRSHTSVRKVWVCVDGSPDKTMLSRCKACCGRKQYGAYYNAAAHLRRVHFNPKEKGRKVRGTSERAGKGGGDWPPMEELKRDWIREVEEKVPIDLCDDEDLEEGTADGTSATNGDSNELLSTPVCETAVTDYLATTTSTSTTALPYVPNSGGDVSRHSQLGLVGDIPFTPMADATFDGVFDFDLPPNSDSFSSGLDESLYTMQSY